MVSKYFGVRRITRVGILVALSVVGAFVKIPSPAGTVAFDSAPAFLAAIAFGGVEGAIVGFLGHIFTAMTTGFPLGLLLHLIVASEMLILIFLVGVVAQKINIWAAAILGVVLNGIVAPLLLVPLLGWGLFVAMLLPLSLGAFLNVSVAVLVSKSLNAAGVTNIKGSS